MSEFTVAIQVIRVYHVDVEAESEDEAIKTVNDMSVEEIAREGRLKLTETDYAEVV